MAQGPGSFAGEYKNAEISLQLAGSGGQYTGTLKYQGASLPVRAGERGNELEGTFRLEAQEFALRLKREGSAVVLTTDGTSYRLEPVAKTRANPLARGSAPAASAPVKEQGLAGAWRNAQGIMRFQPDGSGVAGGAPFRYQVSGNEVTMSGAEGTFRLTYAIEGNTLRLTGPTGQVTLDRVKEESGEGRVASDLAGKWCYVSNVNATGGGARSSNACFSLSPDRRYEYSGESD